jgi:primary-amine oxidase
MATEAATTTSLPIRPAKQAGSHPLAPINAEEIQQAASLVKAVWPKETDIHFKALTLEEPPKAELVPYLEAEFHGQNLPQIQRKVFAAYYLRNTVSVTCESTSGVARADSYIEQTSRGCCQPFHTAD